MLKEHERRRYLESLGEEQRKEAERKLEEQQRRHREHPKVNVPVRTLICGYPTPSPTLQAPQDEKVAKELQFPADPEARRPFKYAQPPPGAAGSCSFSCLRGMTFEGWEGLRLLAHEPLALPSTGQPSPVEGGMGGAGWIGPQQV